MHPGLYAATLRVVSLLALLSLVSAARAATLQADPGNYRSLLPKLLPGDELELASGLYLDGLPLSGIAGTVGRPIIIRGPGDHSARFKASACCNTVQIRDSSHVQVLNLTLDGTGTDGPFGVDARGPTHHITLQDLRIVGYGAQQQIAGISTKGPAWNWVIRRNTIIGAGTGMYLGNSDGSAPFVNGLIEHNAIIDTIGYNLQIKHQQARPAGVGLPIDPSITIIRHNVFAKRSTSSARGEARPNVLVGHFPRTGPGTNDRYEIYGNFFYQNSTEALFQGEGNLVLHDNVMINDRGDGIRIVPHHDRPKLVALFHNTVVTRGTGIWLTGADEAFEQKIIGNAVFEGMSLHGAALPVDQVYAYADAATFLMAPDAPIGKLDARPKTGKLASPGASPAIFARFIEGNTDFDGNPRTGACYGAYEAAGPKPHWTLGLSRKP